jgi:tetratricopeptide (TPR) repeat protein
MAFREAERWLAIGRGALEREGKDDRAEGELLEAEYVTLSVQGYAERTIPLHERAIALFSKVYGPTSPRVAFALTNYAVDLQWVGRREEALTAQLQSIRIQEAIYGALPLMGIDYNNLGWTYLMLGRYDEARQALEHALSLLKPLGENNENTIMVWASMAQLDNRTGRPDATLDDVERAMAIVQATGDNGARYLPCLFVERGMALFAKGDAGGARAACTQSLKLEEAQNLIGPDKVYSDDALTCLGEADLALGKVDEALVHLERGATLKKRDSAAALPLAEFALAKALRTKGESPKRARSLAESALGELRQAAGVDAQKRAVEVWLAAEGGG